MCVDDYAFRHISANRQKICRRFVFKSEQCSDRVFNVNISQFERHNDLCLCEILVHLNKKGLSINNYEFKIVDLGITVEAGDRCLVPFEVMNKKDVIVLMHKIEENNYYEGQMLEISENQESSDEKQVQSKEEMIDEAEELIVNNAMQNQYSKESQKQKITKKKKLSKTGRQKLPEKTVGQALYRTKHWRYLHEKTNFSLKNAAEVVGLSKKTLDDYFLVIRIGQLHGYDFKNNLSQKIGHLRAYIKNQALKIKGRLSKYIEAFKFVDEPPSLELPIKNWEKLEEIEEQLNMN